ncbi:hypothetical protein C8J57DRAFT_1707400, partial [Mycena rebaudengoi]
MSAFKCDPASESASSGTGASSTSFSHWSSADLPVASTSATVASTSAAAPAAPPPSSKAPVFYRISKKATNVLQTFFDTHPAPPTKGELDVLMIKIRAIPGDEGSKAKNVKKWLGKRYSEKKAREAAPVEEKANPEFLSLHKTRKGFDLQQAWFTQERRRDLFETWVRRYGDGDPEVERQIRAWIAHTEVHGLPADAIARLEATSPLLNAAAPCLRVDVSVHDAFGGMLTPSDTTSPEPQFPPFASNLRFASRGPSTAREHRYTPYPLPPTPSSSRAPSLPSMAPKSEPAASPVLSTHTLLPPAPAPYIHAPQPLAAPPEVHLLLLTAISREFTRPQTPARSPSSPSNLDAFARLCSALIPLQKIERLTHDLDQMAQTRPRGAGAQTRRVDVESSSNSESNSNSDTRPSAFFFLSA